MILRGRAATAAVDLAVPAGFLRAGFSAFPDAELTCFNTFSPARTAELTMADTMPVAVMAPGFRRTALNGKHGRLDTSRALSVNDTSVLRHMRQPSLQAAKQTCRRNAAMREPKSTGLAVVYQGQQSDVE